MELVTSQNILLYVNDSLLSCIFVIFCSCKIGLSQGAYNNEVTNLPKFSDFDFSRITLVGSQFHRNDQKFVFNQGRIGLLLGLQYHIDKFICASRHNASTGTHTELVRCRCFNLKKRPWNCKFVDC